MKEQELKVRYEQLNIEEIQWNIQEERTVSMKNFEIFSPDVQRTVNSYDSIQASNSGTKSIPEILYPYAEKLSLHHFLADNISLRAQQPYMGTDLTIDEVELDSLNWLFKEPEKAWN
ncbi:MAG: hypothetical protein LIP01_07195 [Tannerellaceae bacterium]|nr:hypothetical protein [Tannerellaceae bacterium]